MRNGILVVSVVACALMIMPAAKTRAIPLSNLKLVAEGSLPPAEVAAATKNSNGSNGNHGHNNTRVGIFFFTRPMPADANAGELVALAIR